jgi:hypothetical protein
MAELRRYSFETLMGTRTDHLSIKELEDGGKRELVSVLHSGDYPATFVWP